MVERLPAYAEQAGEAATSPPSDSPMPDYLALVNQHNPRQKKKR